MTAHVNLLDLITRDRTLPDGYDQWGIRTVRPDLRSSRGYRWPWPGQHAEAPGPINPDHRGECPSRVGDGICLARTWRGMASGGVPAITLLLCAYRSADLLSAADGDKLRMRAALVVDVIDGADLIRQHGSRAYLAGAYLAGAYLAGANLAGAYLAGANLAGADLAGANLAGANLAGANLARADLAGADLARANLADANLTDANLTDANLAGAVYDRWTRWPDGVDPTPRGAVLHGAPATTAVTREG